MPGTRKLGRPTDQRMAMLRGMVTFLLENGRIETTLTRAKEVSALADKMITLGKKNDLAAYRQALAFITKETVAHNLFSITAHKFEDRQGGYTRIYKLGPRRGDGAEMALIELVGTTEAMQPEKKGAKKAAAKKPAAKKTAAKAGAAKETAEDAVEEIKAEASQTIKKAAKAKAEKNLVETAAEVKAEVAEETAVEAVTEDIKEDTAE